MTRKYRIKKTTRLGGSTGHMPQVKITWFWFNVMSHPVSLDSAEQAIANLKNSQTVKTEMLNR